MKKNWYKLLYIVSTLLVIGFCIRLGVDYFKYNPMINSAPFYVFVLVRALEFLLPSGIVFVIAKIAQRKFS